MHNGHAAKLLPELEPAPAPAAAGDRRATELAIGAAVASAACVLSAGFLEHMDTGGLSAGTKLAGGERIARVYQLSQAFGVGFDDVARHAARPVLLSYFDADYHRHYNTKVGEAIIDEVIDHVLAIVERVARFERAMAN